MLMLGFAMAASSAPVPKRRAAALVAAFRHRGRNHKMSPCDAGRAKIREPGFRPNVSSEADPPTDPVHGPRTRRRHECPGSAQEPAAAMAAAALLPCARVKQAF